jgi:hypothetical protein
MCVQNGTLSMIQTPACWDRMYNWLAQPHQPSSPGPVSREAGNQGDCATLGRIHDLSGILNERNDLV